MGLGAAIRQTRGQVGQVALAERMADPKIDQTRISKWERGIGSPSLDQIRAIEDALGVQRGTILRHAGYVDDLVNAREAIGLDPHLRPAFKAQLIGLYDTLRKFEEEG